KKGDRTMTVTGISIGGGMIQVTELFDPLFWRINVRYWDVLLFLLDVEHKKFPFLVQKQAEAPLADVPGMIARVSSVLSEHQINIAQMNVTREAKGEKAIMILEVDTPNVKEVIEEMKLIPRLHAVNFFN
ncbi:ACT domain-containing protein, partial [Lactococcus lactis]